MSSPSDVVHQGWLTKSPPSKGIFRHRWRRRWFVLRSGSFPNQYILQYFTDESCRRLKGRVDLDECEKLAGPIAAQERHRFTFQIRTPSRTYNLSADSEAEMYKWIRGLCQVCSLKSVEEENAGRGTIVYTKAGDENQPNNNSRPRNEEATESDESSPTLSNKIPSGPYQPLSECFAGKPIPFNEKPESQTATYGNINVFEFPPKVNWATHPKKRDHNSAENSTEATKATTAPANVVAPPRPPKKSPASIAVTVSSPQPSSTATSSGSGTAKPATETEETHDSSSTCSSLHSPPGSAGVVYCNTAELLDAKTTRPVVTGPCIPPGTAKSPSSKNTSTPPPVVDRNLKPLRRETTAADTNFRSPNASRFSTSQKLPTPSYTSGTMTLPSRQYRPGVVTGPIIDRSRKPLDGHSPLTLGPTPAQVKSQVHSQDNWSGMGGRGNVGTLPSSLNRRVGPVLSPNDRRPIIYHEYEQAKDLQVTYLQIDCQTMRGTDSPKFPSNAKKTAHSDPSDSVEYRLIDPVMTQALRTTMEERERKLRNNSISKP